LRGRYWKRGPVENAEADWIAEEIRIPLSELPEMSAAGPSESWISFKVQKFYCISATILKEFTSFLIIF
jgi:hypothetical protein